MENNDFLPIGSVVMLKSGTKSVMVTGYYSIPNNNKNKIYDYSGCIYPEGVIKSNEVCLFNKEQIDKILFKGYVDDSEIQFQNNLKEAVKEIKFDSNHNIINENEGAPEFSVDSGAF